MSTDPALQAAAAKIADGRNVPWTHTAEHPKHGALTFTAELPKATLLLQHSIAIDNRLDEMGLTGSARPGTMILVAALAGMADSLLMAMPVVREDREEDADSGKTTITKVRYDPDEELDVDWLTDVWMGYSMWRGGLLGPEGVDAVKGPSGESEVDGPEHSGASSEASVSPSTTPA